MNARTYVAVAVLGVVGTVLAAAITRKDFIPSPVPAPPSPPVKHCLYVFAEDGCPWCDRLHAEMQRPEAQAALAAFAVSEVKDSVQAWRWRVRSYPTLVVTDAAGGELGRHEGYLSAAALAAWLEGFK